MLVWWRCLKPTISVTVESVIHISLRNEEKQFKTRHCTVTAWRKCLQEAAYQGVLTFVLASS